MGSMLSVAAKNTLKKLSSLTSSQVCYVSSMPSGQVFRQLFDKESSTYTYLLADQETKEAVLIDPVIENSERDAKLVKEMGLTLKFVMNTHVHADHITGTGRLKKLLPGCQSVLAKKAGAQADLMVTEGSKVEFGSQVLDIAETPGHTEGCITYIDRQNGRAFTGDALMIRGCGRTDFQGGSASTLYRSVWDKILSLPDSFLLYPAHDYKGMMHSTVAEEKELNPRLTKSLEDFIKIMDGLNLAYPKKIDESLPANKECGLFKQPEKMKDWVQV